MLALALLALLPLGALQSGEGVPPWERELVIWPASDEDEKPWRDDSRISAQAPEGYPDDFPVVFENPDPAAAAELIWVRAIDYFEPTDEYLGVVLNAPFGVEGIEVQDNAVFHYDPETQHLWALATEGSYRARGIPTRVRREDFDPLWQGIRQYRLSAYGQDELATEKCIAFLSSDTLPVGELASEHDRYLMDFVLGRCHAEAYNTDAAIGAFNRALEHNAADVHAHMALLAEYSLKVHTPLKGTTAEYDPIYEELFLEKLRWVRKHLLTDSSVAAMTLMLFDESQVENLNLLSEEALVRGRQFGFATFRWKAH